jgi:AraC-like DNA-binding protein
MQSIENRLMDDTYNIQRLSLDVGISSRQLQRRIKAITNKSPNQLIRSVRLHKAKEIIVQEKKSIKEAAYLTGFSSLSYFSSSFKKEFGTSPSSFVTSDNV